MLNVTANIENPDDFYQQLIDAQRELSESQAQMMNAKLIFLLANHIGDNGILEQALQIAKSKTN